MQHSLHQYEELFNSSHFGRVPKACLLVLFFTDVDNDVPVWGSEFLGNSSPDLGSRLDPLSQLDFIEEDKPLLPLFSCLWLCLLLLSPEGIRSRLWKEDWSSKEGVLLIFVSLGCYPP